ncbi:MAG: restriction endonuclease subunit S [Alphaproteobacteria bacterium]|nr:restriction endonuclease subunit S [Alphaproteobacteria bacterium]MBU0804328.1 restriction endonuclease subunit S [Alphaproteobacteria bacterium]MBU0871159.1 restriction endonuclease subunit S [Alphaproteobacteria bacterium]MBU1400914.1 restriction endonuclease subunit S [Alphaproteobacteria bacterium]MBU1592669.1 restriction endonuclease subunit S [Alphaproteobacteria bacterium]
MGAVADVVGGGTPSTSDDGNFTEHGIPWLTPADLTGYQDVYISRGRRDLSEKGYRTSAARIMPPGTVLFSSRAPVGYCAIAAGEISTNQGFKSFVLKGELSPEYLRHYLLSSVEYAESKASGTTFKELSGSRAAELAVPVAPIPEQRRIAAKIDSLCGKSRRARDHLDHIPRLVEKYKQAVLAAAFADGFHVVRAGRVDTAAVRRALEELSLEHQKRKTISAGATPEALFHLPPHWCWATAEMVVEPGAEIVYGIVQPGPKLASGVPYVRGTDIENGRIKLNQLLFTSEEIAARYERASLRGGDILLGIIRATKVAIVPDALTGANITQGTARFRPSRLILTSFLARWLESRVAQSWLHSKYRGIDMPGLNLRDVRQLPVPLPPLEEQHIIETSIERAFTWIDRLASEATSARKLIDRLDQAVLAKAFRGELVPQDPADETASVLLERIMAERRTKPKARRGRRAHEA